LTLRLSSCCPLKLHALRLLLLQAADEVGDVGELLLEVTLVLLEALEDALWLVPTVTDAATPKVSASVVHVHPLCSS
jgi:hypothetical protein